MKLAVILHGTDGYPEENWFPWLKEKFESAGYEVWVPQLQDAHTPNRETWDSQLLSERDLSNAIIIGHSSGGVELLNLLMNPRCPHVSTGIAVSAWPSGAPKGGNFSTEQFAKLFPPRGFDAEAINAKVDRLEFLHGAKDPYCPTEATKRLAEQLNAPITVDPNAEHFSAITELPELWQLIERSL